MMFLTVTALMIQSNLGTLIQMKLLGTRGAIRRWCWLFTLSFYYPILKKSDPSLLAATLSGVVTVLNFYTNANSFTLKGIFSQQQQTKFI